ncbi:hypothetical protein AB0M46_11840 [Dactylosporangium sp. NPDC051485]|uniref:hypothetical protein n=1 Tax=Dactylosporangium sp. NPDC051485 TaxID=3154846 RepID=UPI00344A9548
MDGWIAPLLDKASGRLQALERVGLFPSELRVAAAMFERLDRTCGRRISADGELIVLGTTVVADPLLAADDFTLAP